MSRSTGKLMFGTVLAAAALLLSSCAEIQRLQPEPFFAETIPPAKQEFRWSNGKMPKSFDPARAASAPETDVVRALFEGLTELNASTLDAMPAAAERWSSSDDARVWTFQLRRNARWSNGKRVTADDFVDSWKRLIALGEKTAHRELFQNIVGFQNSKPIPTTEPPESVSTPDATPEAHAQGSPMSAETAPPKALPPALESSESKKIEPKPPKAMIGIEALDDLTLKVTLIAPDSDFPKLVAAPIFRPIYGDGREFVDGALDNGVITNGPFKVTVVDKNGISLDRSGTYWNTSAVKLEHVRLVAKDTGEAALEAYKKGEIDALTNAHLEPLALKLLAPYDDFRQTTYSAVNLYKFDVSRAPYNDRRVREALSIAIDRDRLASSELEGAADAAASFLAVSDHTAGKIGFDPARAKKLLESAGFAEAAGLGPVKLLINRNDTQLRVARAVARMWKQNLNLETEITVKETAEIEAAESLHEFDLVRRGVVFATADEPVSLWTISGSPVPKELGKESATDKQPAVRPVKGGPTAPAQEPPTANEVPVTVTEETALYDMNAIPLYFPRSYSLVKPYVSGFETNGFDAVYLPGVSIDSSWQPKAKRRES